MSKNRIKHQSLKKVLPEYLKDALVKPLESYLNVFSCVYYYFEILRPNSPMIYLEANYGSSSSVSIDISEIVSVAVNDFKLKSDLSDAYDKIFSKLSRTRKSSLSYRKRMSSRYNGFDKFLNGLGLNYFDVKGVALTISSMYGANITKEEMNKLESYHGVSAPDGLSIDFLDIRSSLSKLKSQVSLIKKIMSRAKKRIDIGPGEVFFRGKLTNYKKLPKNLKGFESSYEAFLSFVDNTSKWLYLYEDLKNLPIFIDPFAQTWTEDGMQVYALNTGFITYSKKSRSIKVSEVKLDLNYVSISQHQIEVASSRSVYKTMTHEFTHCWQSHASRVHPDRYKKLMNSWTRYYNELSRLSESNPYRRVVAVQQQEDFLQGLEDYIRIRELKNSFKLEFKKVKRKPMYFPNKASLVNRVVGMLVPSKYGMTDPFELMAEMMAMISTGEHSPIGVNINSEMPSFYVPAKRFFKLIDRYGFDK